MYERYLAGLLLLAAMGCGGGSELKKDAFAELEQKAGEAEKLSENSSSVTVATGDEKPVVNEPVPDFGPPSGEKKPGGLSVAVRPETQAPFEPKGAKAAPQQRFHIVDEMPPETEEKFRAKFGHWPKSSEVFFLKSRNQTFHYLAGTRLWWSKRAEAWLPGDPDE